jgi:monofunctional biosynthetic peptidoglycan transglycosylase
LSLSRPSRASPSRWVGRALSAAVALYAMVALAIVAYRFVDPPFTPRSLYRRVFSIASGRELSSRPPATSLDALPRSLVRALLVAEDARFYRHHGFDWEEIRKVAGSNEIERGASTITMQLARNLFLWTGSTLRAPRKAGEVAITPLLELFLTKDRILELYLDWCTFAPGTIGIGEAARQAFDTTPEKLELTESVYLVACLPNPDRYCGEHSSRRHAARMRWIRSRMSHAGAVAPGDD